MQGLDAELSELRSCTKIMLDREREAEDAVKKTKAQNEKTWAEFSMSNPVEYSQIQLLYQINECILKVAEWSFKLPPPLADIEVLVLKDLPRAARDDDFHPEKLLVIVQALQDRLETPRDSVVAFLKNVGTFNLRRALKPRVAGLAIAKQNFDNCMDVMDKNHTCHRDALAVLDVN